jgi:hypothetical protein
MCIVYKDDHLNETGTRFSDDNISLSCEHYTLHGLSINFLYLHDWEEGEGAHSWDLRSTLPVYSGD